MPTGALIAGGLGLVSNVAGGLISSNAAQTAAQQQAAAITQAIQSVQQIYGQGQSTIQGSYNQGAGVLTPVIQQGQGIVSGISPFIDSLLAGGPNALKTLSSTPGFQFSNYWGQNAVSNQATTQGLGGNALTAGANYAEGLAGNTYSNVLAAANQYLTSGTNLTSAGTSPFGSLTGGTIGSVGTLTGNLAGSIGSLTQGLGQAQAQGTLGSASALSNALTGGSNSVGNAFLLRALINKAGGGNSPTTQDQLDDLQSDVATGVYS